MLWRTLLAGFVMAMLPAIPGDRDVRTIDASELRAVEIATLPCDNARQSTSSGFVIDDQLVLTVAHAIYDSRDFAVRDLSGTWYRPTIRAMDLERDLAVLELNELRAQPMDTAPGRRDDAVRMVLGAASGTVSGDITRPVRITTDVVGSRAETSERSGFELGLEIDPGDSGAPVVDQDDRLVGVVFARSTRRANVSWATSVSEIDAVLAASTVPVWECNPDFDVELELTSPEQEQLAG